MFKSLIQINNKHLFGYCLMSLYVFITALSLVSINKFEQTIPSEIMAMGTFIICAVFFNVVNLNKTKSTYLKLFKNKKVFICLNVLTLIIWTSTFEGLKFIEPFVFVLFYMSTIPITSFLLSNLQLRGLNVRSTVHLCLFVAIIFLCYQVVLEISYESVSLNLIIGICLAIVAGAMSALYILYTKKLKANISLTVIEFLATRFYFTIIFSFLISLIMHHPFILDGFSWCKFFIVAILGTIIPLFCLQKAISLIKAYEIVYFMPAIPLTTYILQYILGYHSNVIILVLILALTLVLQLFTYSENRT